jgi:hypothetical protein
VDRSIFFYKSRDSAPCLKTQTPQGFIVEKSRTPPDETLSSTINNSLRKYLKLPDMPMLHLNVANDIVTDGQKCSPRRINEAIQIRFTISWYHSAIVLDARYRSLR